MFLTIEVRTFSKLNFLNGTVFDIETLLKLS